MVTWTQTWPTKPGFYWFYGRRNVLTDLEKQLYIVQAFARGAKIVISGMYNIGWQGQFAEIDKPNLPKD